MRIAVLGGGVSGLAAAWELGRRHEVTLFEARDRLGGNIHTEERDGFRIEWGPNGFLDNEPATLELVRALDLEPRLQRAREEAAIRYVFRKGKLRALPHKPPQFLTSDVLPLTGRLRALLEPWSRPAPERDESVREFAVRHLGRHAADILVDAFVTGIFAGDPARLSVRSAFPRLRALEQEHGSLLKGAKGRGFGPKGVLTSFDHGLQVLIDRLGERVDVRLKAPAETIERGDYDRVICTLPAAHAAQRTDGALAEHLASIPGAPLAVVALMFDKPVPADDAFGFLVPRDQGLRILGTLYDSSIFPHRAPDGARLFRVMMGGRRDPTLLDHDDDAILALALADLERVWGSVPPPAGHRIIRWPGGIAQYELGHADRIAAIDAATPDWLRLTGSSYRGVALNACVKEALSGLDS
ncbi:MAG: protoporphyrinogen oxidase [Planctomycetota bacterium]